MKVTVEKLDDINFVLSGIVENSVIQAKTDMLKKQKPVDEKKDENAETIEQEAAGAVFQDFIQAGIKEAGIEVASVLGQPGLIKTQQEKDGVYFEVAVSISPDIDTDIDYADIVPSFTRPVASPEAIEEKLQEFCTKQAPFSKIATPRAVVNGDVAVIDFSGSIDGVDFEGGSAEKFNLKVGSESFIPGFEEQIIGMEYGEERVITVDFPKDYQATDLAGKESKFAVKLHEIQEQTPIVPDDKFAQGVLADQNATLDTLKGKFSDQITSEELSQVYMSELKPKIVEGLLTKFNFSLPNNIVEQEIDAMVRDKTKGFTQDEHKVYMEDKVEFTKLRESVRVDAQNSIKKALIVEALAEKQGISVNEHEVQAALTYQAMMTNQDAQELVKYYEENNLMTSAKMGLTEDKLFGMMLGFDK